VGELNNAADDSVSTAPGSHRFVDGKVIFVGLILVLAMVWAYRTTFSLLVHRWSVDPEYSHSFLVPAFSAAILWFRRKQISGVSFQPSWTAVLMLGFGAALYLIGDHFYFRWLEQISLLPVIAAGCLALGGWRLLSWAWPAIAFLLFMIPLPGRVESMLAHPLQRIATIASANALQTLGFFAQAEGNVILMSDVELGVVEACSGLRMLVVFFAASTAVAIVQRRSWFQTCFIILSAVPIALLANVLRVTMAGVLHETVGPRAADVVFHELSGLLMVPLALLLLTLELWFLSRLFLAQPHQGPSEATVRKPAAATLRPIVAKAPSRPSPARLNRANATGKR
jgi:exosortase